MRTAQWVACCVFWVLLLNPGIKSAYSPMGRLLCFLGVLLLLQDPVFHSQKVGQQNDHTQPSSSFQLFLELYWWDTEFPVAPNQA